jgi:integrase/recombinase XerD
MMPDDWQRLNATRLHLLVSVRKDIENSFELVRQAVEDLTSKGCFTLELLGARLKGAGATSVNASIQIKEQELRETSHIGTADILRALLLSMNAFSKREVQYIDVSISWLRRFEEFMRASGKGQTTIAIYMRALRSIFNQARAIGIVKEAQYPFGRGRYEIQEGEGRKLALTLEQIGLIARYDDGYEATAKYRDYWLFMYLCNGINVADFVRLRYSDIEDGEISYVRKKTEHRTKSRKAVRAIIVPQMQDIISRWGNKESPDSFIFPILTGKESIEEQRQKAKDLTSCINRKFRSISKALGLPPVSTYTARHSFATVLKRSGASIAYISESLGHTDLKTTENYLASFEREEREKNAALLTRF